MVNSEIFGGFPVLGFRKIVVAVSNCSGILFILAKVFYKGRALVTDHAGRFIIAVGISGTIGSFK